MAIRLLTAACAVALIVSTPEASRLGKEKISLHKSSRRPLTACGVKGESGSSSDRVNMTIVNGQPAPECAWRWQVGLRSSETGRPWCGGQLIAPEWVLTAAHCAGAPNFNVVAGEHRPGLASGTEQSRWAIQTFKHPHYHSRSFHFDLALVRLESPMEINDCVGTVCLPQEGADVDPGTKCWISGWGTLQSGGSFAEVLQEAEVGVIDQQACKDTGYDAHKITDSMLCAQGRDENGIIDACQGDSGGPLVCESGGRWTVYGATSWGQGCAGENYPGVWARVHEGLDWIEQTMEANTGPVPELPECPAFARFRKSDSDGDCQCHIKQFCSISGGTEHDCPTSQHHGAFGGTYFKPSCTGCACYYRK